MLENKEFGYRAKIILLKDDGYTVKPIRRMMNHYDNNIRKWIHRFNEKGITSSNPREDCGLGFSTWSLPILAGFIMHDLKMADKISHTEISNILLKHGTKWRKSKTVLSNKSNDPIEYDLKKSTFKN